MKRISTCALAGLMLLSTLFFLSPSFDVFATREVSPIVCIDDSFTATKLAISNKKNISSEGGTQSSSGGTDKYFLLQPKTKTKVQGVISDGDEGYLSLNAYSASFKGVTIYEKEFTDEQKLTQDKSSFVFELTLPRLETEFAIEARFRFSYHFIDEYGDAWEAGYTEDFLTVSSTGEVTLLDLDAPLFNLKDGIHQLSLCFTYSEKDSAYLVRAYVNEAIAIIDLPWQSFSSGLSAQEFFEYEGYGFYSLNVNGNNRVYGTVYQETDETFYDYYLDDYVPIYEAVNSDYPDAFDASGVSRYSLAIDHLYTAFGFSAPSHLQGSAAEHFSAYGGASIRPASDTKTAGLRFAFGIDRTYYENLTRGAGNVEIGAYIVPEDYLTNGVLNGDTISTLSESKELLKMTANGFSESDDVTDEDTLGFYASIVDLKDYNYARAFRAIAYITVDEATYYSSASESRSANEVARNIAASGELDGKYAEMKELIIDTYLDTVAVLDAVCRPINVSGYAAPYTVTVSGTERLSVSIATNGSFDLENLKIIVIDGVSYNTKGCERIKEGAVTTELRFVYTPPTR